MHYDESSITAAVRAASPEQIAAAAGLLRVYAGWDIPDTPEAERRWVAIALIEGLRHQTLALGYSWESQLAERVLAGDWDMIMSTQEMTDE